MAFEDIYRSEVLQSRRDRSRRSLFWARVLGIMLMLTIGLTLRSEPDLRRALMEAGMNGIARIAGRDSGTQVPQPAALGGLRDRVKVNRHLGGATPPAANETQATADDLGRSLAARRAGD